MQQAVFETDRLIAKELSKSNLSAFHDMQSSPNVMKYVGQKPMSEDESEANLDRLMDHYNNPESGFLVWGVFDKKSNELIGTAALIIEDDGQTAELGYRLREKFWRQGFGSEISAGLINHAFLSLKLEGIFAEVDQRNVASIHILDQTMKRIKAFWNEESSSDDYYYELNKADYEKI